MIHRSVLIGVTNKKHSSEKGTRTGLKITGKSSQCPKKHIERPSETLETIAQEH